MNAIPVVITGVGVVSPLGCSAEELARRFAAGERATGTAVDGEEVVQVDDPPFDSLPADRRSRLGRLDRLCRIVLSASCSATVSARLPIPVDGGERAGISIGTGLGCLLTDEEYFRRVVERGPAAASPQLFSYTVSSAAAGEASIVLGIKGPNATSHMGIAAGLGAIGYAFDLIQIGKADLVLAGGADAVGPALIRALREMRLLKTAEQARPLVDCSAGVWPAEGAGIFVLEREDRALARGARVWGRVRGYAAGFEPRLGGEHAEPSAVQQTLERALSASAVDATAVDRIVGSAHGTPFDEEERSALAALFPAVVGAALHPKSQLGESLAASAPLGMALALAPGAPGAGKTILVSSLCYSGNFVALVVHRS